MQVMDPETGWVQIRPYNKETWSYIRARFKCPVLMMSATMEESSLNRIAGGIAISYDTRQPFLSSFISDNLDLERDQIKVLYKSSDRRNIYEQRRFCSRQIDVGCVNTNL